MSDSTQEATKTPTQQAIDLLRNKVKELAIELPGVTFGYIGSLESWGDDRSWEIFLPHPDRVGSYGDRVSVGITAELPQAVAKWDTFAALARRRYHDGSRRA